MTKQIEAQESHQTLPCLLMPTQIQSVLLPNVTVAEIVTYSEPAAYESHCRFLVGTIVWRGEKVPVVSYELASGAGLSAHSADVRFAVMNGTTGNPDLPFYALIIQGIPRIVQASPEEVTTGRETAGQVDSMIVKTALGSASIPDLKKIEQTLAGAWPEK